MLNGDGNENGKSNEQKKKQQQQRRQQLCTCSTLFVHFFAVVLYDFNVKPSLKLPSLNNSRFLHNRNRRM